MRPWGRVQVRVPGSGWVVCQPGHCLAWWWLRHRGTRLRLCTMRMETGRLRAAGKALVVRAAIYVRISSDRAGAGMGVARQEEDCRALCERLGWQVADVYRDNDVSAFSGQTRPAWQQLNSDIAAG